MLPTFQQIADGLELEDKLREEVAGRFQEVGFSPNDPLILFHLRESFPDPAQLRLSLLHAVREPFLRVLSVEFFYNSRIWEVDQEHLALILREEFGVKSIVFMDNWKARDPHAEARAYTYSCDLMPPVYVRQFEYQILDQISRLLHRYCLNLKGDPAAG